VLSKINLKTLELRSISIESLCQVAEYEQEWLKTKAVNEKLLTENHQLRRGLEKIQNKILCLLCGNCYDHVKSEVELVAGIIRNEGKFNIVGLNHISGLEHLTSIF